MFWINTPLSTVRISQGSPRTYHCIFNRKLCHDRSVCAYSGLLDDHGHGPHGKTAVLEKIMLKIKCVVEFSVVVLKLIMEQVLPQMSEQWLMWAPVLSMNKLRAVLGSSNGHHLTDFCLPFSKYCWYSATAVKVLDSVYTGCWNSYSALCYCTWG